jgi:predicted HTH domain antitoxin
MTTEKSEQKKEKRISVSISLTETERDNLTKIAESYGLSLSAFLRLAANKYAEIDLNNEVR